MADNQIMDSQDIPIDQDFDIEKHLGNLFVEAVRLGASDIHMIPEKNTIYIKFRIEGVFRLYKIISSKHQDHLMAKIKVLGGLHMHETRLPQDGSMTIRVDGGEIYIRISTMPTLYWEKAVFRVLNSTNREVNFENLWFLKHDSIKIQKYLKEKHGLILIVWWTGSGKSTTILTMLKQFDPKDHSIVTLEDPIEYRIQWVSHSQINHQIGFDFSTGLRSLLRQDPDIIMVGEIRDKETAKLCVEAAITGHLVFSTLHANTSMNCIQRLMGLWVDTHMITAGLNLVVSQALVRKLCPNCRLKYIPEPLVLKRIQERLKNISVISNDIFLYKQGENWCEHCNFTGYKWRIGVYEVLEITKTIKQLIINQASWSEIEEQAMKEWMINIQQDGLLKAISGEICYTDLNEKMWEII